MSIPPSDNTFLIHAVEAAPDGVVIVDRDGTVVYANRSMCQLAGTDDLIGRPIDGLVPSDVRAGHTELRKVYGEAPAQRPMGVGLELAVERLDGSAVPVEISLSPMDHPDGFVICTVRDITERLDHQEQIAIANEQLALIAERERIGRDLHDVILQHLYGMGLSVQAISANLDQTSGAKLETVIDDIDRIISEVRTIVFTLGPNGHAGSFGQELADVVAQARRVLGFTPALRLVGPVESALTPEVRTELVASMREALGNVARHAKATQTSVSVALVENSVEMRVVDNGVGPPTDVDTLLGGHGLANLRSRAAAFGGECALVADVGDDGEVSGAVLCWSVPF